MKDTYCPDGHKVIAVSNTMLFSDCFYCKTCDKVYAYELKEVPKSYFEEHFHSDRFEQIKKYALFLEAKETVTFDDLVKLHKIILP